MNFLCTNQKLRRQLTALYVVFRIVTPAQMDSYGLQLIILLSGRTRGVVAEYGHLDTGRALKRY